MNDAEILDLIARLRRGEGSDYEVGEWTGKLKNFTGCPNISDLIFFGNPSDTPEIILIKARQYRPFKL